MKFGLLGKSLKHSWSKEIHGKLHNYEYDLIEIEESSLDDFMKSNDYRGFNVTIPYKQMVIPYCNQISDNAKKIGSVNTVVYDSINGVTGYNTDYYGFIYMLKRAAISVKNKKVLILGSGGTGKTAAIAVEDMGASLITVITRSGENTYDDLNKFKDHQIVINTTPVGMYPNNSDCPIDIDLLKNCSAVIDVIYNPIRTPLLLFAEKKNITCTDGLPMLVSQAAFAGKIFMGDTKFARNIDDIDVDPKIEALIDEILTDFTNIVLIGMPGSGKSHIGHILSEMTNKSFVDTDLEVEKKAGLDIPQIFNIHGESYFRNLESEIITHVSKNRRQIIATGGGAVLSNDNVKALRQNGILIWLKRDIDYLDDKELTNRPLLDDVKSAERIYYERKDIYMKCSDIIVYNNSDAQTTVQNIMNKIDELEIL